MRLIDADALRELLIETLEKIQKNPKMTGQEIHVIAACSMLCEMIDDQPTIDTVQVVRCKDCEFWTKMHDSAQGRCLLTGNYPTGSWYCANGRLKCAEETNG